MKKGSILLVDDDPDLLEYMSAILTDAGFEVDTTRNGQDALDQLQKEIYDMVLTDMRMPGMDGMELLVEIKKRYPELLVVMNTAFASIESAIDAIKQGAEYYIKKPFSEDELVITVDRVLEKKRIIEDNRRLQQEVATKFQVGNIIGVSEPMQKIYALIEKAAKTPANVDIYGETGTGKELVAKAIHYASARNDKAFISINCGSIPETLLESELFGYAKGAFTGALKDKLGLFEAAHGGTLLLDEIGDLSMSMQVKFLRVLEEGEIRRVGDTEQRKIDARIITATNQDLGKLVNEGKFRKDLFYRLHVIPIYMPPLRLRKGDIPLLIEHFLERYNKAFDKNIQGFSDLAIEHLIAYDWPGNVRELENIVQRMVALTDNGVISHTELPSQTREHHIEDSTEFPHPLVSIDEIEKQHIIRVLKASADNYSKAAEILGVHRKTLYQKIKRYNIPKRKVKSTIDE